MYIATPEIPTKTNPKTEFKLYIQSAGEKEERRREGAERNEISMTYRETMFAFAAPLQNISMNK